MITQLFRRASVIAQRTQSRAAPHLDAMVLALQEQGYAAATIKDCVLRADRFCQWLTEQRLAFTDVNEALVDRYTPACRAESDRHVPRVFHTNTLAGCSIWWQFCVKPYHTAPATAHARNGSRPMAGALRRPSRLQGGCGMVHAPQVPALCASPAGVPLPGRRSKLVCAPRLRSCQVLSRTGPSRKRRREDCCECRAQPAALLGLGRGCADGVEAAVPRSRDGV